IKTLTSPTQTIAIDDFEISAMQPIPAPGAATSPAPANAATGIPTTTSLLWTPGANGITQQVHFGPAGNPQLIATLDGAAIAQSPPALTASTTYTWRIDTMNPAGTTAGPTWTFTTAPPPNQPPVLAVIPGVSVVAGQTVAFTASGSDPDVPAQPLIYSLQNAPAGAAIHPASGAFTWRPTQTQAPGSYPMTITVTDDGSPPLSAQRSFTIEVAPTAPPAVSSASLGIDGTFRFQIAGDAGPDYRVWFSENLVDWSLLQTIPAPTPPFWVEDSAAGSFPQRFYKLSLAP
ncbi:MAG: tRNA(Glu)-specific nuclease WapA precursor, partial [Verrucomicrobiota bacterium]